MRLIGLIILAGSLALAPLTARAQVARKVYRVVYMGNSAAALESDLVVAFRQGLRELNYVEGRNLIIDFRWAEGRYERFPALLADAIRLKPDVIVTAGTPGALAAKNATSTIPIVMAAIGDPIAAGLVPSLAHPAGHYGVGLNEPRDRRKTARIAEGAGAARFSHRGAVEFY